MGEKNRQHIKHDAGLQDAGDQAADDVFLFIMADLVRQNGDEFPRRMLFDQGIVQRDSFIFAKAGKKGV